MASSWSLRRTLRDSLLRIKHPDVPLTVALRNTAGVAAPLIAGALGGHLNAGIGIAAGALNVMFSDQPGPYRQRLRAILLAALGGALSGYAGFVFGAQRDAMIALALAWGFAGGMLVLFGTAATRVGMTSMILLVIAAATPLPPAAAANAAALLFAGGALQALLAVIAWPLQRYRPERTALAHTYREIAALARHPPQRDAPPPASDALNALQDILLGRDQAHGRAMEAFRVLLDEAERIRLELLALGELDSAPSSLDAVRAAAANALEAIAAALDAGDPPHGTDVALQCIDQELSTTAASLRPHLQALAGALGAAARNADWAGNRGEQRAASAERALPPALRGAAPLAQLRANLNPHAVVFRHALRMALALALGVAAESVLGLAHGYWLPMTLAIVLRADFASTLQFGLLRAIGTLLGLVLTSTLLLLASSLAAKIAVLAALCFLFRWLANANYALAVAALTGTVVILLDLEGLSPAQSLHDRAIATVLACAAALAGYLAWPTWERGRARTAFALMLESYAAYLDTLAGPGDRTRRSNARAAARVARSNALASLERLRAEPATPTALLALIERLFAHASRLVRSAMALEATLGETGSDPQAAAVAVKLRQLAARVRDPLSAAPAAWPAPDPLPADNAAPVRLYARIDDALAALRHALDAAAP